MFPSETFRASSSFPRTAKLLVVKVRSTRESEIIKKARKLNGVEIIIMNCVSKITWICNLEGHFNIIMLYFYFLI